MYVRCCINCSTASMAARSSAASDSSRLSLALEAASLSSSSLSVSDSIALEARGKLIGMWCEVTAMVRKNEGKRSRIGVVVVVTSGNQTNGARVSSARRDSSDFHVFLKVDSSLRLGTYA